MAKRYRVSAPSRVFGHEPGETFTEDIPEAQEARLLASGAIEKVGGRPAATPVERPEETTDLPASSPWTSSGPTQDKE